MVSGEGFLEIALINPFYWNKTTAYTKYIEWCLKALRAFFTQEQINAIRECLNEVGKSDKTWYMVGIGQTLHLHWGKACFALTPLRTLEEFKEGLDPMLDPMLDPELQQELQRELDQGNHDNDEDMVTVWVSFNWLYRQWSSHTTPIAIGEDTTADKDCSFMKMANRFFEHDEDSRPRPFDKRDRSKGGKVTVINHWTGAGVPIKSGHILRLKVKTAPLSL